MTAPELPPPAEIERGADTDPTSDATRPTEPFVAVSEAWVDACVAADEFVASSWDAVDDPDADPEAWLTSLLAVVLRGPGLAAEPGPDNIASAVSTYLGGGDTDLYADGLGDDLDELSVTVAAGCVEGASSLPLHPDTTATLTEILTS